MENDDGKNNLTLTLLAPLAPVERTASNDVNSVSTTNASRSDVLLNGDITNAKFELESKTLSAVNIYQLPVVYPVEASCAATSGDLLQMSSSTVGVSVQRHSFIGSDVVSCSEADVDQRSISQLLVPHRQVQQHQPHHQGTTNSSAYDTSVSSGGRMSPPCYPGSSTYATLTPFQPLPPISTVSDKFSGGGNGMGFVFMQNQTLAPELSPYGDGSDVYTSYKYNDKGEKYSSEIPAGDQTLHCNSYESSQNGLAMVMNGSSYLMAQQPTIRNFQSSYSVYGHAAHDDSALPVKSEMNEAVTLATVDSLSSYDNIATIYTSNLMSTSSVQPPKAITVAPGSLNANTHMSLNNAVAVAAIVSKRSPTINDLRYQMRVGSPDQPSSSTDMRECEDDASSTPADGGEEINTRDVALRVSNELKKYSIPQAVFAQRVLGRSQGTLSDLLRNPKPWSKLKSGRETFRRMWKWLQEPEYQRMASLRIAGADVSGSYVASPEPLVVQAVKQPVACKRSRESVPVTSTQQQQQPQQQQQQQQLQVPQLLHRTPADNFQSVIASALNQVGAGAPTANTQLATSSSSSSGGGSAGGGSTPKKPRMVFTEIQRRTLVAIFKEIKRPSKEIQATIAEQLGLKVSTVVNFFMNARRRSVDKYLDETTGCSDHDAINSAAVSSTAGSSDDSPRL